MIFICKLSRKYGSGGISWPRFFSIVQYPEIHATVRGPLEQGSKRSRFLRQGRKGFKCFYLFIVFIVVLHLST